MKNIEIYNTLNIDKDSSSIVATFTQEDDAVMEFKLFKDGQEIVLKDQTISLGAERKDGAVIEQDDGFLIKENNVLNITLKKNIIQVVGVVKIQLYLKDKSGEMASNTFNIRVNKKLLGAENVEATNDIKVLNTLVLELKNNTNKLIDDTKSKADKLLSGLQETGDNLSATVKAKTDKIIEDTKAEVDNIKKDYEGLKKVVIDENIGIKLQKDVTELQNGLKSNQALEYSGSSISANDTLEGRTEGMRINGKTLFNLVKNRFEKRTIDRTNSSVLCTNEFFEINTTYTIVYTVNSIESGSSKAVLNLSGGSEGPDIYLTDSMTIGTHKQTFTFSSKPSEKYKNVSIYHFDDSIKKFSDVMIFKGEIDFLLDYFDGIKSFGEVEQEGNKYKISILSQSRNLINDSEKANTEIAYSNGNETFKVKNIVTTGYTPFFFNKSSLKGKVTVKEREYSPTYRWYDKNKTYINGNNLNDIPLNARYVRMRVLGSSSDTINPDDCKFLLIENTDKNLNYEPYKQDKKDILIKEPLRSVGDVYDVMYEDNGHVKIFRNIVQCTFTGDEKGWFSDNTPSGDVITKRFSFNLKSSLSTWGTTDKIICNNFIPIPNNYTSDIEGITIDGQLNLGIRIDKSKLTTPDVEGFKTWLKANPTTIVYQLATPTVEIVENCVDIDLDTYQDKTYFNILNSLPGSLDFKVPSNLGSSLQNLAKEVNNIWDVINNLLVPGILDVNKKVALATIKNNLK